METERKISIAKAMHERYAEEFETIIAEAILEEFDVGEFDEDTDDSIEAAMDISSMVFRLINTYGAETE